MNDNWLILKFFLVFFAALAIFTVFAAFLWLFLVLFGQWTWTTFGLGLVSGLVVL